ncbi:hypothetical protein ST27_05025 [Xanthomonas phaseoli pv. phaseoli]|nr:hypothetical protein ST27_05025 [Xanthomonas phaseoli pv. phaseoli]
MRHAMWKKWLGAIVATVLLATTAGAQELTVMTSGGFTAAFERLAPQYTTQSGVKITTLLGLIRPGFPRHLMAMENSRFGDVYEQQAVYG